jgi:hypothetical protein
VLHFAPTYAEEEWKLVTGAPPLDVAGWCFKPLTVRRDFVRMPVPLGQDITAEQLKPILAKVIPGFSERSDTP